MANVDYDPIKAHEYYEKHKKLKGRHSTRGFSASQKEQFSYARDQLKGQQKSRNEKNREKINAARDKSLEIIEQNKQRQKEQMTNMAKQKIEQIKSRIENAPPGKKKEMKEKLKGAIGGIREKLNAEKQKVNDIASKNKSVARELASTSKKSATERSKKEYEMDLDNAYERIKNSK